MLIWAPLNLLGEFIVDADQMQYALIRADQNCCVRSVKTHDKLCAKKLLEISA